jgi:diguanylate cyclase (GGDEF)-like protein
MAYFFQPSLSGLLVQAVGALLMAALSIALRRTIPRPALRYWSIGWVTLCASLQGLYLASYYSSVAYVGHVVYLLGEYVFGYMVIAGCRHYAFGVPARRSDVWLLAPALAWCLWLARVAGGNINLLFAVHTLIYPYLFFSALRVLHGAKTGPHAEMGLRVMRMALMLLTVDYLHYAPLFATSSYSPIKVIDAYLTYAPLYDLLFQVMLMFGMVMASTGQVQEELEAVNADLKRARDRVEASARLDPLTAALNRRAFAAVLADQNRTGFGLMRGVVVVVDLDDLKLLNDTYGHAAGDAALQGLADALRSCLEGDDLLFRWGGDEFVLILRGATLAHAEARFDGFNEKLRARPMPGAPDPVDLRASVGLSEFSDAATLDHAIARADQAMYRRKKPA